MPSDDPTTTAAKERRGLRRPVRVTMSAGSWLFVWMLTLIGALYTVVGAILVVTDVVR